MEHPIMNPPNPYTGTLRVFPGTLVKVAGRPRPQANRFAINFQTGPSLNPRDDLALHLSPCFNPPRIVRNSLRNSVWALEEAWGNGSNTVLVPGQPFEIMILAEEDQFKIAVNGAHYCEFRHRIPYAEITHLTIDGDVDIERITITSTAAYQQQPTASGPPVAPMPTAAMPPYPVPGAPQTTPSLYPSLSGPAYPPAASAAIPGAPMPMPMPMPGYPSAAPAQQAAPYPGGYPGASMPPGAYQQPTMGPGGYPQAQPPYMQGGAPGPAYPQQPPMSGYNTGYPGQQPHQHGHSSSPFGNLPGGKTLGTLAGLGLGAAAGAAVLSAVNPLKHVKKAFKPKVFKHKGWGGRSSSSSNSSLSSFSSNSS